MYIYICVYMNIIYIYMYYIVYRSICVPRYRFNPIDLGTHLGLTLTLT